MKAVYFIVSAMATLAFAAPSANINAENEAIRAAEIEKRQISGCGPCKNGQKTCYYCPLVSCTYTIQKC
jgi:hypothetical protein